ncbi:MAG: LacI family DNA-binding transcriptional regulator [Anaerolineales bacterium]|nr:LacI family DNA-binding transcriptional regulator [Anaerolineales bacterium]MCB0010663.1 LacI family DNA-binding transcriptional regulator [Anaerolineales bacterium]MCB0017932.1 LacI family DNA-binding transcriptional regulator [Anaerolineales bacterium]MCB0029687.1 LacI family DNA-binding transcriptional regulator [Anaerolineales bacterium]MCB8960020.1 LacI family DNA-binding transcriptional regulator [Ardenticatenales bacterium]
MSKIGRITINEIAKQAGVSKQTVSRVLNNRPDVSSKTRLRIQKIIDSSDYRPSRLARGLTSGSTRTIGVISSDIRHVGPSHTLIGIDEQAYAAGYTISLNLLHEQNESVLDGILRDLMAQPVDGIIWTAVSKNDSYEQVSAKLRNLPIPVVVGGEMQAEGLSAAYTDSFIGAQRATQHLLDQGYATVAIITGPMDERISAQRLVGWQKTVPSPDQDLVFEGDWTAATGYLGLNRLLQQRPDIDAVFASNDQMALGVLKMARELGRRVPQDLGIVGFDDIPEAMFFTPSLTTVRQCLVENGRLLVQELDRQIQAHQNETFYESCVLQTPPELIVRGSSLRRAGTTVEGEVYGVTDKRLTANR